MFERAIESDGVRRVRSIRGQETKLVRFKSAASFRWGSTLGPLAIQSKLLFVGLVLFVSTSCSKTVTPDASTGAAATPASGVSEPGQSQPETSVAAATEHARDEVWIDGDGQKWLGKVPFDAFFDEPYSVASNQTPLNGTAPNVAPVDNGNAVVANGGNPTATIPEVKMPDAPSSETDPATPVAATDPDNAAGDDWGNLITAEALDEEVKSIRNFMNENLQSVGSYNSAMLALPPKAAAIAALAEVASKHPQTVSWKDDAAWIRDLAKQMNASDMQRGAKDQKRLLGLYEAMSDTLNRSKPAGLTDPPASDSFAESAEMRLVMMRMEEAEKKMRTEAGTESLLTSKKTMVAHEASLMAVMAKVVSQPGYGYEDDPEFTGYSKSIIDAAQSIKLSAESGDFAGYEAGLSKIATTCQNCHSKYKND